MASATRQAKMTYTLALTEQEALVLMDVLRSIAGSYTASRRVYTDRIKEALEDCGISRNFTHATDIEGTLQMGSTGCPLD